MVGVEHVMWDGVDFVTEDAEDTKHVEQERRQKVWRASMRAKARRPQVCQRVAR